MTDYRGWTSITGLDDAQIKYAESDGDIVKASENTPLPVRSPVDIPRPLVTPNVGGSPKGLQQFGDGTNDVFYLRVLLNAGDDVVASEALQDGWPDVILLLPGEALQLVSDVAITRVDIVAIGDTTSGSLSSGELVTRAETAANFLLALVSFAFDSTDDVHQVHLKATPPYSAGTAGAPAVTADYVDVSVAGVSYA